MSKTQLAKLALSLIIFAATLWLYTDTAPRGLVVGGGIESESAQLQRVAYRAGLAHSTGYPVYTMVGWLAGQLGEALGENPYTWITYVSAFFGAITAVLFFHFALEFGSAPVALGGTALFAVTNIFWHAATIPETQTLHSVSLIGVLWMILIHLREPDKFYPLAIMALLGGLGAANHRTIALIVPSAGLAVLMTGAWRRWRVRQVVYLALLVALPITSYGYMYARAATDDFVVYHIKPAYVPSYADPEFVTDLIRGTLHDGAVGLEGNFQLPTDDFGERSELVWNNLRSDLRVLGILLGVAGLAMLAWRNPRYVALLGVYLVLWVAFFMSWRLPKAVIYQHAMTAPLVIGWVVLASAPRYVPQLKRYAAQPAILSLLALPIFAFALYLYTENHPVRDQSDDLRGAAYYSVFEQMPYETRLYTGGWSAETFIMLEYIDDIDRRDMIAYETGDRNAAIQQAQNTNLNVYISPFMRSQWGLYAGDTSFVESMALSDAEDGHFLQLRPKDDPRLAAEAEGFIAADAPMTPEIQLYRYYLRGDREHLYLHTYWRADAPPAQNYAVFSHLRQRSDDGGEVLLDNDDNTHPVENSYPTRFWQAGEIVHDVYKLALPDFALPRDDSMAVYVGMTDPMTGQRLGEWRIPLYDVENDWSTILPDEVFEERTQ